MQETVSTAKMDSGISLEELSTSAEFRSLGGHMKRLLVLALQERNLLNAIHKTNPSFNAETVQLIGEEFLQDANVQALVNRYAVGVTGAPQAAISDKDTPTLPAVSESISTVN